MDKIELRQVLRKKPKKELIELIDIFSKECPHFKFNFDVRKPNKELLASRLGSILLNLREEYPNEQNFCIEILSEKKLERSQTNKEKDNIKTIQIIKSIPFNPQKICKHFHTILTEDNNFINLWHEDRQYFGFSSLLRINDLGIPEDVEKCLYERIFISSQSDWDKEMLVKYARYQLDIWEIEFNKILENLNKEEIEVVLALNYIFQSLVANMEKRNEKINYNYDDIPLLKRVCLAQYLKLLNKKNCSDDQLDELAEMINDVIEHKIIDSNIKLLPWSDFE